MTTLVMLTTTDNPFSPFDEYDAWYQWDVSAGYHTTSFLARVVNDSDQLSDTEREDELEHAIDEIVKENVLGVYRKVTKEVVEESEV